MSYVRRLAAEMAMALDDTELYSGAHSIDYIEEYEAAASLVLNGTVARDLRRKNRSDAWHEGAMWAAVEAGAIKHRRIPWLTPGDNPYGEP